MNLKEYLIRADMTPRDFAKIIEYTPQYVYDILSGRRKANRRLAAVISRATQGKVSIEEVMSPRSKRTTLTPISPYDIAESLKDNLEEHG